MGFWHDVGLGTISIVSAAIVGISLNVIAIMPFGVTLLYATESSTHAIFFSATVTTIVV